MADENNTADDLRSLLSASFDEAAGGTADSGKTADAGTGAAADAGKDTAPAKDAKTDAVARGEDGKFAKKEEAGKPDAGKEPAKEKDPKAEDVKSDAKTEAKPDGDKSGDKATDAKSDAKPDGKDAPANWSASDKAMFKLQPAEVQEFLLRRHQAMEADYSKKTAAVADLRKEFEPIQQMFAPHLDVLKAKGLTPQGVIRAWANVETALANGRGVDVVAGMIKSYNIDKAALGKALGFTSPTAATGDTEKDPAKAGAAGADGAAHQPIQLPPELAEELRQLRAKIDARDQADQTAKTQAALDREAKVEADITNFKSAANDKGELLHPYFEEVEPAMVALASSYAASKQPIPPLAELYETAVWANPSTRAAVLASQKVAEQTKAAEEARAKAASARRAASSVTGSPGSGQSSKPIRGEQSLREQLEEAAADLG